MSKTSYYPDRGDVCHIQLQPSAGRELTGPHYVLVLSPKLYNQKSSLMVCCPLTTKYHGSSFQLPVPEGHPVHGWVYADQIKSLDWRERSAAFQCKLSRAFVEEVLDCVLTLVDPD